MRHARQKAFSLLELLISLALLSIFAGIALPAFGQWVDRTRLDVLRDQLHAHLQDARITSVVRNRDIEVCGSTDGLVCDEEWNHGWLVRYADSDQAIQQFRIQTRHVLAWQGFSPRLRFQRNGTVPTGNGRFILCDPKGRDGRQLVINRQGRVKPLPLNDEDRGASCH